MQNQTSGLSVILKQIEAESKAVISEIESKAKAEADKIISEAKAEADNITAEAKTAAEKAYESVLRREKNAMEHDLTQSLLAEKQKLLDGVILGAVEEIRNIGDKEYFEFLKALMKKYAESGSGRVLMSKSDIDRIPKDFEEFLSKEYPGFKAEPSDKVKSGFIVAYNDIDIEENCTFDELAESSMDSIKEKVQRVMFK